MADDSDPWYWDTDRVVREFCTDQRTWKPPTNPPKLPDLRQLEASLRENLIDGESLLGDGSLAPDFFPDIGVRASKHKETIRAAISQLRSRSRQYKIFSLRQDDQDSSDNEVQAAVHSEYIAQVQQTAEQDRKRKLDEERRQESDVSTYNTPQTILSQSPPQTPISTTTSVVPTLTTRRPSSAPSDTVTNSMEPTAKKKRRIAPVLLSENANLDNVRNIPQGILISNMAPEAEDTSQMQGAYLGPDVLNRADILDYEQSDQPLSDGDLEFEYRIKPYPAGLRRQRSRLVKRRLGKSQQGVFRRSKPDMVPGGENPEHYEVLPAYGDSDDEYDSDTWKEIQEEEDERKRREAKRRADLSAEEKKAILDAIMAEQVTAWRRDKLPGLEYKANRLWKNARRDGLKIAIDKENRLIARYKQRLDSYQSDILGQQWSNEADMRKIEGILDQTIVDLQYSSWLVDLLRSPTEPKKFPSQPQKPRDRKAQSLDVSDEEILGSDSELEDRQLRDFIVHDEDVLMAEPEVEETMHGHHEPEVESSAANAEMHNSQDTEDVPMIDGEPAIGFDQSESSPKHQPAVEQNHSGDRESVQSIRELLSSIVVPDPTASTAKSDGDKVADVAVASDGQTFDSEETLDLTQPKTMATPIKSEDSVVPRSKKALAVKISKDKEIIDLTTPVKASPAAAFSPNMLLNASPIGHLDQTNLSDNEKVVVSLLDNLQEQLQSAIFRLSQWKTDLIWKGLILPALRRLEIPRLPSKFVDDKDAFCALHVARLFDAFLGGSPQHLRPWFHSENGRLGLEDKGDRFDKFADFMRKLSLHYIPTKPASEAPHPTALLDDKESSVDAVVVDDPKHTGDTTDEDSDVEDPDAAKSTAKKKRTIVRNKEAQNLREIDQRRMREMEERRQANRAKIAHTGDIQVGEKHRFIINETKQEDEGFIYVPNSIARSIKNHQISGVRFMWNQIVANSQVRQGCLLAHTMGLGKTMQIITLLMTIAESAASPDKSISSQIPDELKESRTLILVPPGLVNNWMDELVIWTNDTEHHLGKFFKLDATYPLLDRQDTIKEWGQGGGILLLGYTLFKQLLLTESMQQILLDRPNLVIADEAHQLKNQKSKLHSSAMRFRTQLRIALTGSPLANQVLEYHSMINWVAPNYLSDLKEFRADYAIPIEAGLRNNSTKTERRRALTRLRSLNETVAPKVHRRTMNSVRNELPQKTEFVIFVPLTELQMKAYEMYMEYHSIGDKPTTAHLFAYLGVLSLLCNHPACFRQKLQESKDAGSKIGPRSAGVSEEDSSSTEDASIALPSQLVSAELQLMRKDINSVDAEKESWKILILKKILQESKEKGDSVLVFSQSIPTLNYLGMVLRRAQFSPTRLDGKTAVKGRQDLVRDFNSGGPGVFLISTTAGGLGLNITGANRVVIFDFKWNPQYELQAVGRAYRMGQKKPVFVYRFVCGGTFEEKMQSRGIFKEQLAARVVDKKNPIPRGEPLSKMLMKPTEPDQHDLDPHLGKDDVLDSVLKSDLRKGIRNIVLADTFEEESLEDEQLTNEEALEARRMVAEHQARLTGRAPQRPSQQPFMLSQPTPVNMVPSPVPSMSSLPGGFSTGLRNPMQNTLMAPRLSNPGLPPTGSAQQSPALQHPFGIYPQSASNFGTNQTGSTPSPMAGPVAAFRPGVIAPVPGTNTRIAAAEDENALRVFSQPKLLRQELYRLWQHSGLVDDKAESTTSASGSFKDLARQIEEAFDEQAAQGRDPAELVRCKMALLHAADRKEILLRIQRSDFTPQELASWPPSHYDAWARAVDERRQDPFKFPPKYMWSPPDNGTKPAGDSSPKFLATEAPATGVPSTEVRGRDSSRDPEATTKSNGERQADPSVQRGGSEPSTAAPRAGPVSSSEEASTAIFRKSHKQDDQAAMKEFHELRRSRTKEPRLPDWAREAVASQGRSATSNSASPAPPAPVRRARNPFQ